MDGASSKGAIGVLEGRARGALDGGPFQTTQLNGDGVGRSAADGSELNGATSILAGGVSAAGEVIAAPPQQVWSRLREAVLPTARPNRDAVYRRALALADISAVGLAQVLTLYLLGRHRLYLPTLAAIPLIVVMAKLIGIYDREELLVRKSALDEAPALFQLSTLYALIVGLLIAGGTERRSFVVLWGVLFLTLIAMRTTARRLCRAATEPERLLVIGDPTVCEAIRTKVSRLPALHSAVVAQVSLDNVIVEHEGLTALSHAGDLDALATEYRIDRIIVAPERADAEEVLNVIHAANSRGLKVSVVPRVLEAVGSSVEFDEIEGLQLLSTRGARLNRSSQLLKRAMDLSCSLVGLLITTPLLAAVAVAIRLDSRGPVLFRQLRVGRDGKSFEMLKFRTMVDGADARKQELNHLNEAVGLFKIAADPRITRVGRLLRRTSLDELPQLFNVVRGEMSIVGPRPLILEEDRMVIGWHRRRLEITPGMTGHWQVLGSARIPLEEMVRIDYLYVTNWSLWSDLKILLRTVPYVLSRRGM